MNPSTFNFILMPLSKIAATSVYEVQDRKMAANPFFFMIGLLEKELQIRFLGQ